MMFDELRKFQDQLGATLSPEGIPVSFGNTRQALNAAQTGVALYDRSHWGLLQLKGDDRKRFLHNQTTSNINLLKLGQGCETVFVTSTGRTIDLVTVYMTVDGIILLVSPNRHRQLIQWIDKFIFPMDKVELRDLIGQNAIFTLIGPRSNMILEKIGLTSIIGQPDGNHIVGEVGESLVRIGVGSGLTLPGYTLIVPKTEAIAVWQELAKAGAIMMGEQVWEKLRILQGRPTPDLELTEDYNPLEAGLWQYISFDKGCYIGQETIARLNTYKGVKQRLWGIKLPQPVEPGTPVMLEEDKIGVVTSCTDIEEGGFGLGYVRTKAGGEGLWVTVAGQQGELVSVPFLSHEYYQPIKP